MNRYSIKNITPLSNLSNKDNMYLNLATEAAIDSSFNSSKRLGTCIKIKNHTYVGCNNHRTRSGGISSISLHAEIDVLIKYLKTHTKKKVLSTNLILAPSTIYIVRLMLNTINLPSHKQHRYGISKPCDNCQHYLYKYNVKNIFYTDVIDNIEVLVEMKMI